jgi:hypothetical protein
MDNARIFTHNQRRKSEQIAVGQAPRLNNTKENNFLQPILCRFDNFAVVGLISGFLNTGELNKMVMTAMDLEALANNPADEAARLTPTVTTLWQQLQQLPPSPLTSGRGLKLGLSLHRGSFNSIEGSLWCPTLVLATALTPRYRLVIDFGREHLLHLRSVLGSLKPLTRPNRRLHINWLPPKPTNATTPPGTRQARISLSETVLGQRLSQPSIYQFPAPQPAELTADPELLALLDREASTLRPDDWPMISHIRGAWAYVDRGRAWGLEMNDRLILQRPGDKLIKGHVVGFFGPHLKLKSPRGFPIHEGAIVFIRKGQRDVRRGQVLRFDPTEYPTPWPPQPTPLPQDN